MKEIKNEKSPRPDGFLIEFCKQMWHVVDIAYLKVCQEVIKGGWYGGLLMLLGL